MASDARALSSLAFPQPGSHPLQGHFYGEPGRRHGADYVHLGGRRGAGVEDVLSVLQLTLSTRQMLVQPLHALSTV